MPALQSGRSTDSYRTDVLRKVENSHIVPSRNKQTKRSFTKNVWKNRSVINEFACTKKNYIKDGIWGLLKLKYGTHPESE